MKWKCRRNCLNQIKEIIVGSTALNHWFPGWKVHDLDVLVDETLDLKPNSERDVIPLPAWLIDEFPQVDGIATADAIYTLKLSHMHWDIDWNKHKSHVLVLEIKGCKLIEPLYARLVGYWSKKFGNKEFLSLRKPKSDFFDDYVTYVVDHDKLHDLVSGDREPVYKSVLADGEEVMVDVKRFNNLDIEDQLRMFKEEITVIALERWMLNPHNRGKFTIPQAWSLSLKKTVTSLTKGWATDFILRHLMYYSKPNGQVMAQIMEKYNAI